jgi:hypothetical protein
MLFFVIVRLANKRFIIWYTDETDGADLYRFLIKNFKLHHLWLLISLIKASIKNFKQLRDLRKLSLK